MENFREFLKSKNYFNQLNKSFEMIDDVASEITEAIDNASMDNLTDTQNIDAVLDKVQDDVSPEVNDEEPKKVNDKKIEKETMDAVLHSNFYNELKKACRSFIRISNNKLNGFEIPKDKRSIVMKKLNVVMCGYQIPFEIFMQEPVNGDVNNLDKLPMNDDNTVAVLSSDYYGISFFNRNDFTITDNNSDNYAEKLLNDVAKELSKSNKLTYEFLKAGSLKELKNDQSLDDDVLVGYMRMYNFANYVSKNIIEKYYKENKIPVIVSDRSDLFIKN